MTLRCLNIFVGVSAVVAQIGPHAEAQVILLHSFVGATIDGANPQGALVSSGSELYGLTEAGGSSADAGTIFGIGTNGAGYAPVHVFGAAPNDGSAPFGSLIILGTGFYGVTHGGGNTDDGTVFTTRPDGSVYGLIHQFINDPGSGKGPLGSLTQVGSALFGTTSAGGSTNGGTIFKVNPDGTSYSTVHSFMGGAADGQNPMFGAPAVSGTTLFGMTSAGGTTGNGVVYKISTDGTGFAVLHSFTLNVNDGFDPFGSVIVVGSTIYGMTQGGGSSGNGVIFKMSTDGSGFSLLHSFAAGPNDGRDPMGELLLSGSTLYGMTYRGGSADDGTIFSIGLDGSNYDMLHSFVGGANDGANPASDLIQVGSTYYGTTVFGGANNDGTVFSFTPVPEPSSLLLAAAGRAALLARRRCRGRGEKGSATFRSP